MNEELIKDNIKKLGNAEPTKVYKAGYKNALKDVIALFKHPEVKVTPEYLNKLRNNIKL